MDQSYKSFSYVREKKWVSVGGNTCKLKVYKWVPKAPVEKADDGIDAKNATTAETEGKPTTDTAEVKPEGNPENKEPVPFPTSQFLPTVDQVIRNIFDY